MLEELILFIVHSDNDENNVYQEFRDRDEAINYAYENGPDTFVTAVEVAMVDGEVVEEFGSEVIWIYGEEPLVDVIEVEEVDPFTLDFEDAEETSKYVITDSTEAPSEIDYEEVDFSTLNSEKELDELFDVSLDLGIDGGDNNAVRVLSSYDPKQEGEELDELFDADINLSLDGGTGNNVGVLSPGFGLGEELEDDELILEHTLAELEEHEDEVECKYCNELFPKEECIKEADVRYVCPHCAKQAEPVDVEGNELEVDKEAPVVAVVELTPEQLEVVSNLEIEMQDSKEAEEVECQVCYEHVDKDVCTRTDGGYYICDKCMSKESGEPLVESKEIPTYTLDELESVISAGLDLNMSDEISDEEGWFSTEYIIVGPYTGSRFGKYIMWELRTDQDGDDTEEEYDSFDSIIEVAEYLENEGLAHITDLDQPLKESKPLEESSLVKGNYEISPTEHLEWGWEKGEGYYVEKNYRPSEKEDIWQTEFRKTYATEQDAKRAFARYKKQAMIDLKEQTHAQYAKPEGDKIKAYNNALKYAKRDNVEYIYGYSNHTGKFFALEQPIKAGEDDAEKKFRNKYKNCLTVYMAYPDKDFI